MYAAPPTATAAMQPAVTHDDLSLRKAQERRAARSGGQVAVSLVALSVLCGLVAFILCLAAEGSRSEVSHYLLSVNGSPEQVDACVYSGSGRLALAYAVGAFILLAVAMFAEHAYMLVAVAAAPESAAPGLAVAHDHPRVASTAAALTWQTGCLFFLTWICFGLAEVMLMIGIAVESGHMTDWRKPRPVCHRVRPGMFAAAGILGLVTVVVGFVVYITAVQAQRLRGQQHHQYGGGHLVGYGAPYPGAQHQHQHLRPPVPHPHGHGPQPHPGPSAPEITAAPCQGRPSRASLITKEAADV